MPTDLIAHAHIARDLEKAYGLTVRETDVLRGWLLGKSYRKIASDMEVSVNTVKTHAKAVNGKLGIQRRAELLALVIAKLRS